jgi:GDP-4-dehydro-6-deoxy-D-mannose reductase
MPARTLITGIGGFAAGHLARLLLEHGHAVTGTYLPGHRPEGLPGDVHLLPAALEDQAGLAAILRAAEPEWLFHLAGITAEPEARKHPERALTVNLLGTLHLLEACLTRKPRPRVLITGSAAEYGRVRPEENPVREEQPLRPSSPYGVSKASQGLLALQYHAAHGLEVVHARAFNHTGPGQRDGFAAATFARQIAEAEAGRRKPEVEVGDLAPRRDLSDVRDVVRAYLLLMERAAPGETYNIGSGHAVPIQEVLDHLLALSPTPLTVVPTPSRRRPVDVPLLAADTTKLLAATGWQPEILLPQTLSDLLESWRARVGAGR